VNWILELLDDFGFSLSVIGLVAVFIGLLGGLFETLAGLGK